MALWLVVIVAAIGGAAVAFQGQLAGLMDNRLGTTESVFVTYASGGLVIALVMAGLRGGNLAQIRTLPWYVWLSGLLGLVIVGAISFSAGRVGLVRALTIFTAAQFILAAVIDHFGLLEAPVRPIDAGRIVGMGLLMAGTWLVLR